MVAATQSMGLRSAREQRVARTVPTKAEGPDEGQDYRCQLYLDGAPFEEDSSQDYGPAGGVPEHDFTAEL